MGRFTTPIGKGRRFTRADPPKKRVRAVSDAQAHTEIHSNDADHSDDCDCDGEDCSSGD